MYYNEQLDIIINNIAEVAGYLWARGWAERNGGNITVNVTEHIDADFRSRKAISPAVAIGITYPHIAGMYFFCKGTNKRMRDLARWPMENGSIVRITDDGASYEIIAENPVVPTSEIIAHLGMHNYFIATGSAHRAVVHTHPIEIVALTHHEPFLQKDVLSKLLWSMIPETRAFCPKGLGIARYELPGSIKLAEATIEQLKEYDAVAWEKHGTCSVGADVLAAFDILDVLNKSALIYLRAKSMGFEPKGMSEGQMNELKEVFNL